MTALPSHASKEICKRERAEMRQNIPDAFPDAQRVTYPVGTLRWLLDECDHLEREYESMAADARHWREMWNKATDEVVRLMTLVRRLGGEPNP